MMLLDTRHIDTSRAKLRLPAMNSLSLLGLLVVIIIILLPGYTAWANEFVVDQKHPSASDTNDGSQKRPWKTISHAAKVAVAGDSVSVRDGIYRESIEVANSGVAKRMIVFKSAGKNVVIKGSDVVTDWKLWKGRIWKKENWSVNSQQVFVDNKILDQVGGNPFYSPDRLPAVGNGPGNLTPGAFYYDSKGKILYIWLKDGDNPNRHQVESSVRPWLFLVRGKNYIKLSGFIFQHSNTTAVIKTGWPAVNISGDNCTAENNNISWCDFAGMGGTGNNLVIRNNSSNYNGNSGMGFSGKNNLLEGNTTNYNNYRSFDVAWHAGGIKNTQLKNSIITRHTAIGNKGQGIWCDIDCDDIEITASLVSGNSETGIFYEISKRSLIRNNIVYGNGSAGIYISASSGCNILNNLTYANSRGLVMHGVPRTYSGVTYELRDNRVQNNIIISNTDADLVVAPDAQNAGNNKADYNLFHNKNGKSIFKLGYGRTLQGITAWQVATGNDVHSNEASPKFIDIAKHNFRSSTGSPAIGRGLPNRLVGIDFDGNLRDKKTNDIGPFRFNNPSQKTR